MASVRSRKGTEEVQAEEREEPSLMRFLFWTFADWLPLSRPRTEASRSAHREVLHCLMDQVLTAER